MSKTIPFKYGGWYADLDFLFLRPLSHISANVLASTWGRRDYDHLTNCIMHLQPGHPLLASYARMFAEGFDPQGDRDQAGPPMLTRAVRNLCNLTEGFHMQDLTGDNVMLKPKGQEIRYLIKFQTHPSATT